MKNSNQAVNIQEITNTFITQIAHLAAFDVWATSSTDGTVKIWDADNIIIR